MAQSLIQANLTAHGRIAMCPSCQGHALRPKGAPPHQQQLRYACDFRHVDGIGQMVVEFFMCEQCGTRMQRDHAGLGRRQRWRTV